MPFTDFEEVMTRGDTHPIRFTVEVGGAAEPISEWQKFWFTAKRRPSDAAAVIALTTPGASGITLVNAPGGVLEVLIEPEHTESIAAGTHLRLVAELQGKDPDGAIYTLAQGVLIIGPDVEAATS